MGEVFPTHVGVTAVHLRLEPVEDVFPTNTQDYYQHGKRDWFRLREKGGKVHDLVAHDKAQEYMDADLGEAGIRDAKDTPFYQTIDSKRRPTDRRMDRSRPVKCASLGRAKRDAIRAGSGHGARCRRGRRLTSRDCREYA